VLESGNAGDVPITTGSVEKCKSPADSCIIVGTYLFIGKDGVPVGVALFNVDGYQIEVRGNGGKGYRIRIKCAVLSTDACSAGKEDAPLS